MRIHILVLALLWCTTVFANPSFNDLSTDWRQGERWLTVETPHFRIHYREGAEDWVAHTADRAEAAHARLSEELNWQPRQRTELVLTDNYDLANGWASALPFNQSRLFLSPPDRFNSLENHDDWLDMLITHEYTHVLHLDKGDGVPLGVRRVLGRFPFLFPNQFQPTFMIEGLAIQKESDAERLRGRAYSALYEGEIRAQVAAGPRSLSQVSVTNRRWPSGDGYLYGAFFYRFLEETRGQARIDALIEDYSSNLLPFALNSTARRVYGARFPALWAAYQQWLQDTFAEDGAPLSGEALTHHGLASYPPVVRGDALYRIHDDGHARPRLVRYRAGMAPETIARPRNPGLFDVSTRGHIVMASAQLRRENRLWSDLYLHDGRRWQRLTRDGRYREARWLDADTLIARRQINGLPALHRLRSNGEDLGPVWQGRHGEVLGQFSLHPDGTHLVAAFKPAGRSWQLARIDVPAQDEHGTDRESGTLTLLTDNDFIQGEPSFVEDGSLLFSADYPPADGTGRSRRFNSWRLPAEGGAPERLTDVNTAAMTPVQTRDGTVYVQHLSASGYDLWRLHDATALADAAADANHQAQPSLHTTPGEALATPDSTPGLSPGPRPDPEARLDAETRPYRPWYSLRPRWWLPVLLANDDSLQAGFSTAGQDALGEHQYALTLTWETRSEEPAGFATWQFSNRWLLFGERDLSFSSDDGEVTRVRASDTLSLSRLNLWNALHDRLELRAGVFVERDSDRFVADGIAPFIDRQRGLAGLALLYDNRQQFRYSISPAAGRRIALTAETNDALSSDFEGEVYSLDYREFLHLGRSHVLALRAAGSWGTDAPKPVRLGDHPGESLSVFGRDRYLLRGYPDNEIFGRRAALGSVEWRFPLARIQRNAQTWPLGVRDLHGALFSDTGAVWNDTPGPRDDTAFTSVGGEITTELVLGYNLILPLRLGVAHGLDNTLGETRGYIALGAAF
ncbi:hypothetical protein K8B33_00485 [Alcanivorax sp. JB21]|uniref:hypothetical protein n=1 Tax=Alcanivorax limicola TaxID=2874102 RepID=UPI001CC117A6|nr:hypothetical protein [Alcanivorax limicola]MBZ2187561.1 hypothetical protein [Alcanivorax limicola]